HRRYPDREPVFRGDFLARLPAKPGGRGRHERQGHGGTLTGARGEDAGEPASSPQSSQAEKGSLTRMVSSRSGLVESRATGASISSSMRRTYLMAGAGSSAQLRAPRVLSAQPSCTS